MTEAPERIRNWEADVEYVRKDLYDAAIADMRRSDAACYDWAEISQASYQRAKRAEAERDELQWQPIETAPKDGRELLLFDGYVHLGSWTNDSNYPDEPKQWFDNSYDDYSCGYASTPLKPTHWLLKPSLPTPPIEEP